jgi:uncharacterized protein
MHYYIDGYNLLFRLIRSDDDRFSEEREQVIRALSHQFELLQIDATLVFDAQYQAGEAVRSHMKQLEVVFTDQGETADDYIIEQLRESRRQAQETVVTSDKKLAWYARRCSAKTESVEAFLKLLQSRYKNKLKGQKLMLQPPQKAKRKSAAPTLPAAEISADQCQDYYLQIFEKEYQKIEESTPKKPAKLKSKKPKEPVEKLDALSEMERWLRLFEQK